MNNIHRKILNILDTEIICEYKNAESPISESLIFHNHDGYETYLFLGGDVNYYTESDGKKLERGDLILTSPYAFHGSVMIRPDQYDRIVINIRESVFRSLCSQKTNLSECFLRTSSSRLNLLCLDEEDIRSFAETALSLQTELQRRSWGNDVMIRALLQQCLVLINRKVVSNRPPEYSGIMPDFLAETFSYIDKHLSEEITLRQLANHVHHNETYLSRCFKNVSGTSPYQYILAKRIALAQQLLREGYSPNDACDLSGFHNYSNFSRFFSKQTGYSPRQYQNFIRQTWQSSSSAQDRNPGA